MRVAGIIAEYNPFHSGHAYQLQAVRDAGAKYIAVVMSGCFVQRGEIACALPAVRARAAVLSGADLVIALPLPYALSRAQSFALGGVRLLDALGCVDTLCFGSEGGKLSTLIAAAGCVDAPECANRIRELMASGITYAAARETAVSELCGVETAKALRSPNDTLAVEYIRALTATKSAVRPFAVLRRGAGHDEPQDSANPAPAGLSASSAAIDGSGSPAISAMALRRLLSQGELDTFFKFIPETARECFSESALARLMPSDAKKLETALLFKLRSMRREAFSNAPDISEGLENRIYSAVRRAATLDELYAAVKTKRYTLARIRRIILSACLDIPGSFCTLAPPYIHVLAFNSRGRELLGLARPSLPLSHSLARLEKESAAAMSFAQLEAKSADLFALALPSPPPCGILYREPPFIAQR